MTNHLKYQNSPNDSTIIYSIDEGRNQPFDAVFSNRPTKIEGNQLVDLNFSFKTEYFDAAKSNTPNVLYQQGLYPQIWENR